MRDTKPRILDAARELFNQRGSANVSTRDIAEALGISQGNLTYHFPQREMMVEALYFRMTEALDNLIAGLATGQPGLATLYGWTLEQGKIQARYRFIWLEFAHIRKQYPAIDQHFSGMMAMREQQFGHLIDMLATLGELHPPENHEGRRWLFEQIVVLGNFWLHAAEVFQPSEMDLAHFARLTLSPLYPYLTDAGKKNWQNL